MVSARAGGRLTPAHDLRGAARQEELTLASPAVPACTNRQAAPRRVHALARRHTACWPYQFIACWTCTAARPEDVLPGE